MTLYRLPLALAFLAAATGAAASPLPAQTTRATQAQAQRNILPLAVTEATLSNGLTVIVVPTGFPNIVSLQIPVQTGSRNEIEPGKSGFAHFFEHMMFRGTDSVPPDAYRAILARAGARQNAYTTDDFTNYHTTFAKEDLETMLRVEADRFRNLRYSEDDFRTEARAVLGEYNKNIANPFQKLFEVQRESAFTTHTYRHTTMGFLRDIEEMPNQFEYSKVFFDRWYRPEHTAIIVAGDVTAAEVVPLVEKYWGGWQRGTYSADIPEEPAPREAVYAHVPWDSETLPIVSVAFHGPAFSVRENDQAAVAMLTNLYFGPTSELYRRLVEQERKTDILFASQPANQDAALITIAARLRTLDDAVHVRDEILRTIARARTELVDAGRLADAKSNQRYGFARSMDNTETIASTLARFVRYERSFNTINQVFRLYDSLTPEDLRRAAQRYFTDERMVVTTLSHGTMPDAVREIPRLSTLAAGSREGAQRSEAQTGGDSGASTSATGSTSPTAPATATTSTAARPTRDDVVGAAAREITVVRQPSQLPQLNMKLLFTVGSAYDPPGKEGLSALAAAMIANAGSRSMRIDEISRALYPLAGSFSAQVDKEMTTFTGVIHRDNWERFVDVALPQLLEPGFRQEDFERLRTRQLNALTQDLRNANEEELGKERLQALIFRGSPYEHPVLGTVAGIESITLEDVREFVRTAYVRGNLTLGIAGDAPDELEARLRGSLATLSGGAGLPRRGEIRARTPEGIEVEIIQKDTRAVAISLGHAIDVTRAHPDFAALWLARAWLGEHRATMAHLFRRIREERGMNYGTYAYIEAFPRGMFQFFPDPNVARRAQIFEVWIRPVEPYHAHMALRIAIHELDQLHRNGLTQQQFEEIRDYLMKNVYVMTATQNQKLGYELDSRWYETGEFTLWMRERLEALTLADVNRAIRSHLSPRNLSVVMIARDADELRRALVSDAPSTVRYDGEKSAALLEEDRIIGSLRLNIPAARVRVVDVGEIFAR